MPSNHLILCHPLLLLPSIFPSIRVFSNESGLHIRWSEYWSFNFNISPSNKYSGLIFFRTDWFDLLAVQGTLKSLLQNHSSKVNVSVFFNMLSRFVIDFLPRNKGLLVSWLQSPSAVILEPKKIKYLTVSIFSPSVCYKVMGLAAMILVFWMLSFKPAFSLSSFTLIRKLFSSSSLSAISVVSSVYLRLLIFLLAILIPACASYSLAFHSAYKLNKQDDNIQPWSTPFPNFEPVHCSMSSSNCCFLTCVQISQEGGKLVWYSHL